MASAAFSQYLAKSMPVMAEFMEAVGIKRQSRSRALERSTR